MQTNPVSFDTRPDGDANEDPEIKSEEVWEMACVPNVSVLRNF